MSAPTIRSDYDQLRGMATSFRNQSEEISKQAQQIKAQVDDLQGGNWIGKGATAFYQEMGDTVMPTMQRLQKALAEAGRITQQISQVMKAAEDEASGCFHL
jgi:WXG100 family type VII secretion target